MQDNPVAAGFLGLVKRLVRCGQRTLLVPHGVTGMTLRNEERP